MLDESKVELIVELIKAILGFLSALVWPTVVFCAIYLFRDNIAQLLRGIRSFKYPGGEVSIQREDPEATKPERETATQVKYVDPAGFYTKAGLARLVSESGFVDDSERAVDELLLFDTPGQHTWLIATTRQLFCVLDDQNTRTSGRLIQWKLPLDKATPIRARTSEMGNPVVDIGTKRNWLYSRHLHSDEQLLERDIVSLIRKGRGAAI
jgi:hypothetical protein